MNGVGWRGRKNCGFDGEAGRLADPTRRLLSIDVVTNGSLNEHRRPDIGLALCRNGFRDWTLSVLEMM